MKTTCFATHPPKTWNRFCAQANVWIESFTQPDRWIKHQRIDSPTSARPSRMNHSVASPAWNIWMCFGCKSMFFQCILAHEKNLLLQVFFCPWLVPGVLTNQLARNSATYIILHGSINSTMHVLRIIVWPGNSPKEIIKIWKRKGIYAAADHGVVERCQFHHSCQLGTFRGIQKNEFEN